MCFGPFRYSTKHGAKRVKLVQLMQKFVHEGVSEFLTTNAPNPPHWTLNTCFGVFHTRWVHLGPSCCLTKLISKWAEMVQLMQRFVPWSRVGILHNKRIRSTPFYPKLKLWCVSYILDVFRTISLQHETRCKMIQTGVINAKFVPRKCRNFSRQTHPIHPIGP